jgi:peptidoglycan/LPS O-acetylase OafA/YrhL
MTRESSAPDLVPASLELVHPARIRELDGLRGIAILGVFCHHVLFSTVLVRDDRWSLPVRIAEGFAHPGVYGVDLFFVLSGFLITSILLADRSRPHYYRNFYWRRALRILPLYFAMLVWVAVAFPASHRYLLLAFVFLANFHPIFHLPAYGPFWTLAIEEQFYVFWPRISRYMTVDRLRRLSICLAAGCLGLRMVDAIFGHSNYRFTFFHCDGLAIGAALACELSLLRSGSLQQARSPKLVRGLWMTGAAGLALAVLATALPRTDRGMVLSSPFILTGINLLGYCAVKTAVVFSGAKFLAILRSRVLVFFGLISYAMYLFHEYVIWYFDRSVARLRVESTSGYFVRFFAVLAVTVALSLISRYAIELPAMSLRRFVLRRS